MLGVVIVAHGNLARSYVDVVEQMIGTQQAIECVSYNIGDDLETLRETIAYAISAVDRQRGVVVLTDMFGSVTSNLAIAVAHGRNAEVISGMNLTMLLKLLTTRDVLSANESVKQARTIGKKYIYVLSELLEDLGAGRQPNQPPSNQGGGGYDPNQGGYNQGGYSQGGYNQGGYDQNQQGYSQTGYDPNQKQYY